MILLLFWPHLAGRHYLDVIKTTTITSTMITTRTTLEQTHKSCQSQLQYVWISGKLMGSGLSS